MTDGQTAIFIVGNASEFQYWIRYCQSRYNDAIIVYACGKILYDENIVAKVSRRLADSFLPPRAMQFVVELMMLAQASDYRRNR